MPNLAYKLITGFIISSDLFFSDVKNTFSLHQMLLVKSAFPLRDAKQKLTNEMKVNLITKPITFFKTNSSLSLQQGKIQIETLWQC